MLKVTVNGNNEFDIQLSGEKMTIKGKEVLPDLVKISETRYHLILNHKSYRINILEKRSEKDLTVEVNGNKYDLGIKDRYDQLLHEMGMDTMTAAKADFIKAPMPGLVINILVKEGDEVEKDTPLLILEAMKMENILKATSHGTVDQIKVNIKDAVEKNQLLISFK